jgi:hypothetical protein
VARLIFIEGFPGAGKSTTAQFLARLLARRGALARWVYEGEEPNPFVPTARAGGYESWEQFVEMRVKRWRARGLSGFDGLLAYWRAHAELCGEIVEALHVPKLVLEVGPDDWAERRRRICDFVDIPFEDEPILDIAERERIAGRYGDGRRQVAIEMVGERLVVRGIHWLTDALLPVRRHVFDFESWPVRVSFDVDAAGHAHAFHCDGPRLAWGAPSGVFIRIP